MSKVMIEDLATYLATQWSLTRNTTLWIGAFPEDKPAAGSVGVCLRESGGAGRTGYSVVDQYSVQVIVRGAAGASDFAAMRSFAEDIWITLFPAPDKRGLRNVTLSPDWLAHVIEPIQTPADLGMDPESQRRSFTFNLIVRAVRITAGA